MIDSIFYNIFCSFVISFASFYTGFYIFKKKKESKEAKYFSFFWLSVALTWFCIGFYTLLLPNINLFFILGSQVGIALSFVAFAFYISYRIWGKINKTAFFFYFLFFLLFLLSIFLLPTPEFVITDWGIAFLIPAPTIIAFFIILGISLFLACIDLFARAAQWKKTRNIIELYRFFATFSAFLYIFAGSLDQFLFQVIYFAGIGLFLIRIIEMFSALLAYICFSGEAFEKENSIG